MALARAAALKRTVLRGSPAPLFVGSFASQFARAMGSKAIVPDVVRKGKAVTAEPQDLLSVLSREISYEKEDATSAETLKDIAASIPDFSVVGEHPPPGVHLTFNPVDSVGDADSKGQARFFLTRKFQNTEIRVDLDCSPVPADDDEGFDEGWSYLRAGYLMHVPSLQRLKRECRSRGRIARRGGPGCYRRVSHAHLHQGCIQGQRNAAWRLHHGSPPRTSRNHV